MAKVTEHDLIDRGFRKKDNSYFYYYPHEILGMIEIEVYQNTILLRYRPFDSFKDLADLFLTHSNLDLFIRFANGEKI